MLRELSGPLGPGTEGAAPERVATVVDRLLRDAADRDRREELVDRLLEDPPLAAAIFQNVDLLFTHGHPGADAVGSLVMRVVERAFEAEEGGAELG